MFCKGGEDKYLEWGGPLQVQPPETQIGGMRIEEEGGEDRLEPMDI